jgi:hypothetical protein
MFVERLLSLVYKCLVPPNATDQIDQYIALRNIRAIEAHILNGDYINLDDRVFPPGTENLKNIIYSLQVYI